MANFWRKRIYEDTALIGDSLARLGYVYQVDIRQSLSSGATASIGLRTPPTQRINLYAEEITTLEAALSASMFEGSTITASSGSVAPVNLNRDGLASTASVFASVSTSGAGTLVHQHLIGSGEKSGATQIDEHMLLLKENTTYVILLNNIGNQTAVTNVHLVFSEGEPDAYNIVQYPNTSDSGTT